MYNTVLPNTANLFVFHKQTCMPDVSNILRVKWQFHYFLRVIFVKKLKGTVCTNMYFVLHYAL
jgi:hypothetical protein